MTSHHIGMLFFGNPEFRSIISKQPSLPEQDQEAVDKEDEENFLTKIFRKVFPQQYAIFKQEDDENLFTKIYRKARFSEYARYKIPIPPAKGCNISRETPYGLLHTSDGVVCIYGPLRKHDHRYSSYSIYLWNPYYEGDIKALPSSNDLRRTLRKNGTTVRTTPVACGFFSVPKPQDKRDYRVVMILQDRQQLEKYGAAPSIYVCSYSSNKNSWGNKIFKYRCSSSSSGTPPSTSDSSSRNLLSRIQFHWSNASGIFFNEALHWTALRRQEERLPIFTLVSVDGENVVREMDVPISLSDSSGRCLYPFVYKGSHLALSAYDTLMPPIHKIRGELQVWVMQDYGNDKSWTRHKCIILPWDLRHAPAPKRERKTVEEAGGIFLESDDQDLVLHDTQDSLSRDHVVEDDDLVGHGLEDIFVLIQSLTRCCTRNSCQKSEKLFT